VADSPRAREIPAIVLDSFDPDARAYSRASTQPIPLRVRARAGDPAPVGFAAFGSVLWLLGIVALVLLLLAWGPCASRGAAAPRAARAARA
jgi:hypothetical protein